MEKSKFLTIGTTDAVKSLIVAALTGGITVLITMLNAGIFPTNKNDWTKIGITTLSAGLGYLLKNIFTNSKDQFGKPEPKTKNKTETKTDSNQK